MSIPSVGGGWNTILVEHFNDKMPANLLFRTISRSIATVFNIIFGYQELYSIKLTLTH